MAGILGTVSERHWQKSKFVDHWPIPIPENESDRRSCSSNRESADNRSMLSRCSRYSEKTFWVHIQVRTGTFSQAEIAASRSFFDDTSSAAAPLCLLIDILLQSWPRDILVDYHKRHAQDPQRAVSSLLDSENGLEEACLQDLPAFICVEVESRDKCSPIERAEKKAQFSNEFKSNFSLEEQMRPSV